MRDLGEDLCLFFFVVFLVSGVLFILLNVMEMDIIGVLFNLFFF